MTFKSLSFIIIFLTIFSSSGTFAHEWNGSTIPTHLRGDGIITIFRPITGEKKAFRYRDHLGNYDGDTLAEIAYFFHCRLTNEIHGIDPALIEILDAIEDRFAGHEIRLISAYRSETRNNSMSRRRSRVAKRSLHMDGRAADVEVVGISSIKIRDFVHSLGQGGVGYYGRTRFVHVDTGPLRTWGWKPATQRTSPAVANK
jgi:uncharacterized protein YcbK (DUF882 family)